MTAVAILYILSAHSAVSHPCPYYTVSMGQWYMYITAVCAKLANLKLTNVEDACVLARMFAARGKGDLIHSVRTGSTIQDQHPTTHVHNSNPEWYAKWLAFRANLGVKRLTVTI